MKIFKLSLIAISLLLIGCGSSDSKSSEAKLTPIKTVDDAKTSYKVLDSSIQTAFSELDEKYNNFLQKIQKITSQKCVNDDGKVTY